MLAWSVPKSGRTALRFGLASHYGERNNKKGYPQRTSHHFSFHSAEFLRHLRGSHYRLP
jgi:hypothetical protein